MICGDATGVVGLTGPAMPVDGRHASTSSEAATM
jgi:hypothetical protein